VTLADLLADVIRRLAQAGIPYMVTGSVASTFHGEPRATRDLDIVIDPEPDTLAALVDDLASDGYYVDLRRGLCRTTRTKPVQRDRTSGYQGRSHHSQGPPVLARGILATA